MNTESSMCDWEPQGNGHYLTTCGELIFDRTFSPTRDKRCRICRKPFTDATYINTREKESAMNDELDKAQQRYIGRTTGIWTALCYTQWDFDTFTADPILSRGTYGF